jgi:transcriptional regulator with XRE-family HTH domain
MNNKDKLKLFGKNVAFFRNAKGFSQQELAEKLSISREHLAKIETARRGVSIKLLFKLSDVLGITEQKLFDFKSNFAKK